MEGAFSLNHEWQLVDVPKADALPALRGLRDHLKSKGWEIVSFDPSPSGDNWTLRTKREGEGRMVFDWYEDGDRFNGGAHAECAYDPSRKTGDTTLTSDMTAGIDAPALGPRAGR